MAHDDATGDAPSPVRPRWSAVYLVCKACGKRGNGPKRLKPKALAALVRRATKHDDERARVVMTTCLGLCPRKAGALARVGRGETRIVAVASEREAATAVQRLAGAAES